MTLSYRGGAFFSGEKCTGRWNQNVVVSACISLFLEMTLQTDLQTDLQTKIIAIVCISHY